MQSNERSAEFYRGEVWQWATKTPLFTLQDLLAAAEAREAGEVKAADVINELREALEEVDGYRGGADTVLEDRYVTERRHDALEMARAYAQRSTREIIFGTREALVGLSIRPQAPTAAEVIEAAEKALDTFARAYRISMEPFGLQIDQADGASHWMPGAWPTVGEFKNANDAYALCARWKEANRGK